MYFWSFKMGEFIQSHSAKGVYTHQCQRLVMNRPCCFYGTVPCLELKSKFQARDKPAKETLNSENLYPLEVQIPELSVLNPGVNGRFHV